MTQNYSELAGFVAAHKSDPLSLAKIVTGWIWTSLLPAEAGHEPTSAKDVPIVMRASCGWRDILMNSLFDGIGIEHRRVNFYDVPFQANHTATELYINGKWMFFDSTFGLYFTKAGSSVPLSMEEARHLWPDVVIHQSSLQGWQGVFVDPKEISAKSYHAITDTFAFAPSEYAHSDTVVTGELYNLYFVKKATYLSDDGREDAIPDNERSWSILTDTGDSKGWKKYTNFFNAEGRLDAKYLLMDDGSHAFTHWDRDSHYNWLTKITNVSAGSRLERSIINYDDRSKDVRMVDAKSAEAWDETFTHYSTNRKVDYSIVKYDDGSSLQNQYDARSNYAWAQHSTAYDISGQLVSTTVVLDDGSSRVFDWTAAQTFHGTPGSDSLAGTVGNDALTGGDGNDVLDGGANWDLMAGGSGNDIYYVDNVSDVVIEKPGGGHDIVLSSDNFLLGGDVEDLILGGNAIYGTGQDLDNWLGGNAMNNVLTGGGGNDRLLGREGNDLLIGGAGRDTIEGGLGADRLYGSADADTFLWRSVEEVGSSLKSSDFVKDFSAVQGDKLNFKLIDADTTHSGNQAFTFVGDSGFTAPGQIRYAYSGQTTLLYFNTDGDASAEAVLRIAGHLTPDSSWFTL